MPHARSRRVVRAFLRPYSGWTSVVVGQCRYSGRQRVLLFALQAANPKALIFFVALLPQFINANHAIAPQVLRLGVTSVIIEFFVLAAYGYSAARAATIAREPKFVAVTNRVGGGMLVAAGAGIALGTER